MKIIEKGYKIYLENNQKFNSVYLGVCFHQPLKADTAAKNRLLPLVMSESCKKYNSKIKLNKALAELGGAELNIQAVKKGAEMILQFIVTAPQQNLRKCFELLHDIIFEPLIIDNEFAVSKKEYLKKLIADKVSDPKTYALDRCIEIMFEGKGFGTDADGKIEDVDNTGNLYEHYLYVINNSKTEIFVIGNTEENEVITYAEKYFCELKNSDINTENFVPCELKTVKECADTAQTRLCIGIDMGQGSRFEKMIYNEILGGENSLLFKEIREGKGLCYYIGSTYFSLANSIFIQAGIEEKDVEKVIEAIKAVIAEKNDEKMLNSAKKALIDRLSGIDDMPLSLADFYITQSIFGDNISPETMSDELNKIQEISLKPAVKMIYVLGGKNDESKNA